MVAMLTIVSPISAFADAQNQNVEKNTTHAEISTPIFGILRSTNTIFSQFYRLESRPLSWKRRSIGFDTAARLVVVRKVDYLLPDGGPYRDGTC